MITFEELLFVAFIVYYKASHKFCVSNWIRKFHQKRTIVFYILKDEDLQSLEQEALEEHRELPAVNIDDDTLLDHTSQNNENSFLTEADLQVSEKSIDGEDRSHEKANTKCASKEKVTRSPRRGSRTSCTSQKKNYSGALERVQCPYCGKYLTRQYVPQHIDSVHKKLKPHQCERCGKKYSERGSLRKHKRDVHGLVSVWSSTVDCVCKLEAFITLHCLIAGNDI